MKYGKEELRKRTKSTGVGCNFIHHGFVGSEDKLKVMFKTEN